MTHSIEVPLQVLASNNEANHQHKQNNNNYNNTGNGILKSTENLLTVGADNNDIRVETVSSLPSSINVSRRSTITYDVSESVKKSPSSIDIEKASAAMNLNKSHSFRNRFRERRHGKGCRRASTGLLFY